MAETHETIAIRVRRRLGLPESATLGLQPLVDVVLRRLCYDLAKDPNSRNWVLTSPATTTATLDANGVADLTTLIASPRIILECLRYGEITDPSNDLPMRFLAHTGQGLLAGAYDSLQLKCWLDGSSLYTKSSDNNATPLSGPLSFSVPYWLTIAQLNDSLTERLVMHPDWVNQQNVAA